MGDVNSVLNGEAVTVRVVKLGKWLGNGAYGDVTDLYGTTNVTVNVTSTGATRFGDGSKRLAQYRTITGATIAVTFAGDLTSVGKILGIDLTTTGSTPNQVRKLRIKSGTVGYVGLVAAFDLDTGEDNAVHIFAPKCQFSDDSIQIMNVTGGETAAFGTLTMTLTAVQDDYWEEGGANEVQTLGLGSPTTGNYTLTLGNQTTGNIAYNANAAAIQAALVALQAIGSGDVTVTGSSPTFTITFGGALAEKRLPKLVAAGVGGFDGTLTVTQTTRGVEPETFMLGVYEVEDLNTPNLPPLYSA